MEAEGQGKGDWEEVPKARARRGGDERGGRHCLLSLSLSLSPLPLLSLFSPNLSQCLPLPLFSLPLSSHTPVSSPNYSLSPSPVSLSLSLSSRSHPLTQSPLPPHPPTTQFTFYTLYPLRRVFFKAVVDTGPTLKALRWNRGPSGTPVNQGKLQKPVWCIDLLL